MTADPPITVTFNLHHRQADPDAIKPLIEKLRQKAIESGFLRVSELFCHTTKIDILCSEYGLRFLNPDLEIVPDIPPAVCYFQGSLSDSEPVEVGLAYDPFAVEIDGHSVPYGQPMWTWNGMTRTCDLKTLSKLLYHAAEVGINSFFSFAGMSIVYSLDVSNGKVTVEQEWDDEF